MKKLLDDIQFNIKILGSYESCKYNLILFKQWLDTDNDSFYHKEYKSKSVNPG